MIRSGRAYPKEGTPVRILGRRRVKMRETAHHRYDEIRRDTTRYDSTTSTKARRDTTDTTKGKLLRALCSVDALALRLGRERQDTL